LNQRFDYEGTKMEKTTLLFAILTTILLFGVVLDVYFVLSLNDRASEIEELTAQVDSLNSRSNNQLMQIINLQNEVEDMQNTRRVLDDSFDITADGDVVQEFGTSELHWKRVVIPELTLSDMPLVNVYYKPNDNTPSTPDYMWRTAGEGLGSLPTCYAVYDEQAVLIFYKRVHTDGTTDYFMNGEYKIVVVK